MEILQLPWSQHCPLVKTPHLKSQLNCIANFLQDNSSAWAMQKTQLLYCGKGVFTAPLYSNGRSTDHTKNTALLLLREYMLWVLPSNGHRVIAQQRVYMPQYTLSFYSLLRDFNLPWSFLPHGVVTHFPCCSYGDIKLTLSVLMNLIPFLQSGTQTCYTEYFGMISPSTWIAWQVVITKFCLVCFVYWQCYYVKLKFQPIY
jgi:hypothetical protein